LEFQRRFAAQVLLLYPGCPAQREQAIARHAGSGRVGRSAAGRVLDEQAITLVVVASIRHPWLTTRGGFVGGRCDTPFMNTHIEDTPPAGALPAELVRSALPLGCLRIMQGILRHMKKAPPPPLLPLLRSRLQADLLTLVLLAPDAELSLTELARRIGASVSSAQREVSRAEQAGVVSTRRLGNTRLVRVADSPLTGPLTELLLRSFGPRQVLAEELSTVAGVDAVYLFGSWAARYAGEGGRPPADLDVLVIGKPDRDALDDAAQRAGERLAREVNVTIRSLQWWQDGADGFHTEVTRRPLVTVLGEAGAS
jgi:DNA-binding Lrp family transcriptional regulator